ncbi:MAG TPA: hypothetical protein VFH73_24280, partial [Polyangia bacterium]|nr:hypothetical protein [Polyangia bacterium]
MRKPKNLESPRSVVFTRLAAVLLGLVLVLTASVAGANKPEDLFKGKIIITKGRLPLKFSSPAAFVAALQKQKTDKIWPTEENGPDHGVWNLEYIAFFAQPLNDNEIQVKFYDITGG